MKIIGLAGSAGSGKSAVARRLSEREDVEWIDLDQVAWATYASDGEAYGPLCTRFGSDILSKGQIDRRRLAKKAFRDTESRHDLEAIVHPAVMRALLPLIEDARARDVGFLLIEGAVLASSEHVDLRDFDAILWLDAPEPVRRTRLREQGREDHVGRSRKPFPNADVLEISTEGSLDEAVDRVWMAIEHGETGSV